MVSVELLAALDALLRLRSGERAAAYLQCTQSTVSRHSRRCLEVFGLQMKKRSGEWCLLGDQTLLDLQRGVHQLLRWRRGSGLRLGAQHWCGHLLETGLPAPWISGNGNFFEYDQPLKLLERGVIDAWLCGAPDIPQHPDFHAVQLTAMPLQLVVKTGHPLLDRGFQLRLEDLADFPVLPLPDGAFPQAQRVLEVLQLWSCPERDRRFRQAAWIGHVPVEELMIAFDNPLRMAAGASEGWWPLPLTVPLLVGDAVVVKREFASSFHFGTLLDGLRHRARQLSDGLPEVDVLVDSSEGGRVQPGLKASATPLLQ
ncbi:MAG: LysR substrate-binding domain-containing protein [Cyanobacteriota bacterium]|nr:LysR substrate-binding domain-containing protein [Cyanobacteriota bacterium]